MPPSPAPNSSSDAGSGTFLTVISQIPTSNGSSKAIIGAVAWSDVTPAVKAPTHASPFEVAKELGYKVP